MPFLEKDLKVGSCLTYDDKRTKYFSRIVINIISSYTNSDKERFIVANVYLNDDRPKHNDRIFIFTSYIQADLWSIL